MSEPSRAVFLSYASQDAEAAQRICAALRAAGIRVFFDQSELRGGDAWDQKIRHEIHDCALFMPVISANTAARHEGYFRLEWDLADQRSHMIAHNRAFIVPVSVDETSDTSADTPESFRRVQWTRLPGGETPPAFVERVRRLLSGDASTTFGAPVVSGTGPARVQAAQSRWTKRALPAGVALVIAVVAGYVAIDKLWISTHAVPTVAAPAAFNPPPHSIAVLPFVNMSGDKDQEYFSDGLTEELLNSLSRINELQVAARTSSFSFQGEHPDIAAVAHRLNVGAVLEGSVRRSRNTLRVTTQLVNGITGFHVWSQTYDRDLGDVLKLQTEIATAVAEALKVTLLADVPTKIEVGGTRNPAAYDAYLRSASAYWRVGSARDAQAVIAGYQEAVRLDPNFALAYAELSISLTAYAQTWAHGAAASDFRVQARAPAFKAVALAPELAEGHLASFFVHNLSIEFARANEEIERAMALAPGNARVLRNYGAFAGYMGHTDAGIAAMRRAVALDPLNANSHGYLSDALRLARRYDEALAAFQNFVALARNDPSAAVSGSLAYYALGDFEKMRMLCEGVRQSEIDKVQDCLALAYRKLGRQANAESALARLKALEGNGGAYRYAIIYAQWGDTPKALEWLETALQLRDPQLRHLKAEPLLDPLRKEPRFHAIERALKFPD